MKFLCSNRLGSFNIGRSFFDALTSNGRLGINNIVAHIAGDYSAGVYRIDQYTTNKANLSVIVTRLSGDSYGGLFQNKLTSLTRVNQKKLNDLDKEYIMQARRKLLSTGLYTEDEIMEAERLSQSNNPQE